jgi:hypothetical protein
VEPAAGVARVILDPSVLFTEEALRWLEMPELRRYLAVSQALWMRLEDPEAGAQFVPFGVHPSPEEIQRVRRALAEIEKFSGDRPNLPPGTLEIRGRLLASNEPLTDVLADEWVFVTTQSIAVLRAVARRTLDAFRDAGARVYEVTDQKMKKTLDNIEAHVPPGLRSNMKRVDRKLNQVSRSRPGKLVSLGTTIVVLGGTIGVIAVPHLALGKGAAMAIRQGVAVIAGDP